MTANQLNIGDRAMITRFGKDDIGLILNEMGIFEGGTIELASCSPLGDPICIKTNETIVSIRKTDARFIEIKRI